MTGPKHLWSGDWREESDAAADQLNDRQAQDPGREPAAPPPVPAPVSAAPAPVAAAAATDRPRVRRPVVAKLRRARVPHARLIALAIVVLAAGAYGLSTVLGSSGRPGASSTVAARPAILPASTTNPPSRPLRWLGMEVVTLAPGAVAIETVQQGSPADDAGLQPGDVIVSINGHIVTSTAAIAPAISGLHAGDPVAMQISHGSALFNTAVTLAGPPRAYP